MIKKTLQDNQTLDFCIIAIEGTGDYRTKMQKGHKFGYYRGDGKYGRKCRYDDKADGENARAQCIFKINIRSIFKYL